MFQEISPHDMNLDYHVREEESKGWSVLEVEAFMNQLYIGKKDLSAPLWQFHVMNNLRDGRHCILVDVDHAVGDGYSISASCMYLLDNFDKMSSMGNVSLSIKSKIRNKTVYKKTKAAAQSVVTLTSILPSVIRVVGSILMPGDSRNRFKNENHREPSSRKVYAYSSPIPLSVAKTLKGKFEGATINDILMAALNMALIKYFEEINDPILHSYRRVISASFPINMRTDPDISKQFGNKVSVGTFYFDLWSRDRTDIFWSVKAQFDKLKRSIQVIF